MDRCASSRSVFFLSSLACQSARVFSLSPIWRRASALNFCFQASSCSSCSDSSSARACTHCTSSMQRCVCSAVHFIQRQGALNPHQICCIYCQTQADTAVQLACYGYFRAASTLGVSVPQECMRRRHWPLGICHCECLRAVTSAHRHPCCVHLLACTCEPGRPCQQSCLHVPHLFATHYSLAQV